MKEWLLEKRWRTILAGVLTVAIPLVGLTIYVYSQVSSEFERSILEEDRTFFNVAVNLLEERIETEISNGKTFAARPLLIDALIRDDRKNIRTHLKSLIDNSNTIEKAFVVTTKGILISDYPVDPLIAGKDFSRMEWYREVSGLWLPYISDFSLRDTEPRIYLFSIAIPVKDSSGAVVGILVLQPEEDYLKDVLGHIRIGRSFIYAVDKKGNLIFHPQFRLNKIVDFSGLPAVAKVKRGVAGIEKYLDPYSKEKVISAFRPMKWGWGVIMQRPEEEISEPIKKIVAGLFVVTGIFLLLGGIVAYKGGQLLFSVRQLSLRLHEQGLREKEINERLQVELAERSQAEERLRIAKDDLERSNKDLEQFAYIASHDLQEPLRKIASFTELLERRYRDKLDPDADRYINYIVDGAKRMRMLIHDLLAYSRLGIREKQFVHTDCNKVLEHVLGDIQKSIMESGATVTYDELPLLIVDRLQISQVFQNLIGNAIKFRRDEPPRIHVSAAREGNGWIFSVRDNGIGIEPEFFDRIFTMFQRLHTRTEYPGTGIGLAICKKIIERHGGQLWLESEIGKGSTFYFKIPEMREGIEHES